MFAGSRRWEKKIVKNGCPWVLCLDVKADPDHDLTQPDLRAQVELLISSGVVIAVGAGPPCSSMSIAVTPPIRTREVPCGKPDLLPPLRAKRRIGNLLANWSAAVYRPCASLDCAVWVENPDASWMWKLRSWKRVQSNSMNIYGEFRVDYCRFGSRWRKRRRFARNTSMQGETCLCKGGHEHWRLLGTHGSTDRTKLAEAYPWPLCSKLASACCQHAGWHQPQKQMR